MIYKQQLHPAFMRSDIVPARNFSIPPERGSVMLIALLLLGAIVLSTVYLSLVLMNEIKSTRFSDNSIVSHYVAETASEHALWHLKLAKARIEEEGTAAAEQFKDLESDRTLCAAEAGIYERGCVSFCWAPAYQHIRCEDTNDNCETHGGCSARDLSSDPERTYVYTSVAIATPDFTVYNVPRNSPVFMDIYDPLIEGTSGTIPFTELDVDWFVPSCNNSAKLEITYTPVAISSYQLGVPTTLINICDCNVTNSKTSNGVNIDPNGHMYKCAASLAQKSTRFPLMNGSSSFYRLSVRSLDTPMSKLVITGVPTLAIPNPMIPSQVEVHSVGTYRESQTAVSFRTLWKDTLSGIFNYVIFSEDSLIKDTKGETSTAYDSACGFCAGGADPAISCSDDATCTAVDPGFECSITNTIDDAIDGADTSSFCFDSANGEIYTEGSPISQTNAGSCNALCNGKTFCGDSFRQNADTNTGPNGLGTGGTPVLPASPNGIGNEECDEGPLNSDDLPLTCRENCRIPYCGDGVLDSGGYSNPVTGNVITFDEACDDGNALDTDTCYPPGHTEGECQRTYCGDNITQTPNGLNFSEDCDGTDSTCGTCNSNCTCP